MNFAKVINYIDYEDIANPVKSVVRRNTKIAFKLGENKMRTHYLKTHVFLDKTSYFRFLGEAEKVT